MEILKFREHLFSLLSDKYGSEKALQMLNIHGLSENKLDPYVLTKEFMLSDDTTDVTVDPNANVGNEKFMNKLRYEPYKALHKLVGFKFLYDKFVELYGRKRADELVVKMLDGSLYTHDPTGILQIYCGVFVSRVLLEEGRKYGDLHSLPAKKPRSYIGQLIETILNLSQEHAGAVATSDLFVCYSMVFLRQYAENYNMSINDALNRLVKAIKSNKRLRKQIEDDLQSFVHVMHNKFRASGDSLRYDTLILVRKNGKHFWVKIGEFVEKEMWKDGVYEAFSFNPYSGKVSWKKIKEGLKHKTKNKFVKVKLKTGQEIVVTDNHSLFSFKDGRVVLTAPKYKPNNILVPIGFIPDKVSSLSRVDLDLSLGRKGYNDIYWGEDFCYFLGLYCGDGHVDGSTIGLSLFNKELEEWVINYLSKIVKDFSYRYKNGTIMLNVGRPLAQKVGELCGRGAENKRVPTELFSLSKDCALAFMNGYIDADGTVSKNGYISFGTVSFGLYQDLILLLLGIGILPGVHKPAEGGVKHFNISGKEYDSNMRKCYKIGVSKRYLPLFNFKHLMKESRRISNLRSCEYGVYKKVDEKEIRNIFDDLIGEVDNYGLDICYENLPDIKARLEYQLDYFKEWCDAFRKITSVDLEKVCRFAFLPKNVSKFYSKRDLVASRFSSVSSWLTSLKEKFYKNLEVQELRYEDVLYSLGLLENLVPVLVDSIEEVEQEEFSYDISVEENENFLAGHSIFAHNSPFVNVSIFDTPLLKIMLNEGGYWILLENYGAEINDKFQDLFIDLVKKVQSIFIEFMAKGDPVKGGSPYRFPVVTLNFSIDKNGNLKDSKYVRRLVKYNTKGYFNIFHSYDSVKVASCCRLVQDYELMRGIDSFGNGAFTPIGSTRVVSINLPRIGYLAQDKEEALNILKQTIRDARDILYAHRKLVEDLINNGYLLPFQLGWYNLKTFFSTFGFIGVYEMVNAISPLAIENEDKFVHLVEEILHTFNEEVKKYIQEDKVPYNIEQVPGESLASTFYKLDCVYFDKEPNAPVKLYSNQFIPLWEDVDLIKKVRIESNFYKLLTGGGITHLNCERELTVDQIMNFIKFAAKCGLEHYAFNPFLSVCENGHTFLGREKKCRICGSENVRYFTRIVGYFTDVSSWYKERREEFWKRTALVK